MNERKPTSLTRLILACAVLLLGASWAGARWGQRQPVNVGAGPRGGSAIPAPSGNGGGNVEEHERGRARCRAH